MVSNGKRITSYSFSNIFLSPAITYADTVPTSHSASAPNPSARIRRPGNIVFFSISDKIRSTLITLLIFAQEAISNGKRITSYSFKIFIFLFPAIFYPSLVLLGSASAVV